jgi:STAS domain
VNLRCEGKILRGSEAAILCAATRQHPRNIILDLGKVDEIDAAGVGALIALQAAGIYLKLMNPTKQVCEVLSQAGAEPIFEISCSTAKPEQHEWFTSEVSVLKQQRLSAASSDTSAS